eukprot:502866_1
MNSNNAVDDAFDVVNLDDSKMDSSLYKILKENNLYNDLHEILNENNLTMDILCQIKTNEFEELCNTLKLSILKKAKFRVLMDLIHKTVYDEGDVDVDLKEFFDEHKLSDLYYMFRKQKIDFEKLESLTTSDIHNLCATNNIQIGTKIDLINAIETHQREILKQQYLTPGGPICPEKIEEKDNRKFDEQMKVILVGDSGVGKTALLKRFIWNKFDINEHMSTIGIDMCYAYKKLSNGKIMKMNIWDTAGQERFRTIPRLHYRDADAIIVCYSVGSKLSFRICDEWREEIEQYAKDNIVVMLVGCKGEKKFRIDPNKNKYGQPREVSIVDARTKAESDLWKKYETQWGECSAKNGINVENIFMTVAELTMQRRAYQPELEGGNRNVNPIRLQVIQPQQQNAVQFKSCWDRFWSVFH